MNKYLLYVLLIFLFLFTAMPYSDLGEVSANNPNELTTPQLIKLAKENGEISEETAYLYLSYALSNYDILPTQFKSDIPWDGTLVLKQLLETAQELSKGPELFAIESILAGACGTDGNSLPSTYNSPNFHIQHSSIGGGLTIENYIAAFETAWQIEISDFGWAAPPVLPSNPPPGNRYHVRIQNLGGGLFGFVAPSGTHAGLVGNNPNTPWNDMDAYASCMVITNDLSQLSSDPQSALEATVAHELNHSIQFGYGVLSGSNIPDDSFIEAGATWMEDEVFDASNDNYNFLWPRFNQCMGEYRENPYSYWITFRGLTEQFGNGGSGAGEQVMQDFWEESSKSSTSNMLEALNTALERRGINLGSAFHNYAIAVKFNKSCNSNNPAPFCFEEGPEYVNLAGLPPAHKTIKNIGGSTSVSIEDNYAINWIRLPDADSNYDITLTNTSSGGQLRGSVVCETGKTLKITGFTKIAGKNETSSVFNINPSKCTKVIAVITNQSQTAANPTFCKAQSYTITTSLSDEFTNETFFPFIVSNLSNVTPTVEIPNWNFEKGVEDWTEYSSNGWDIIVDTLPPGITTRSGEWLAWLGGDNNETSYLEQKLSVPNDLSELSFWHWIDSDDECGGEIDYVEIVINGSNIEDSFDLCSSTNTISWEERIIDLSSYAGKNIEFRIRVKTDDSLPSSLFLDDFSFDPNNPFNSNQSSQTIQLHTTNKTKSDVLEK